MIKIIMHGCNGKMGQVITKIAEADSKVEIVAGVDQFQGVQNPYPVFSSMEACDAEADVVIDFSNAAAVDGLLDYCVNRQLPVVLCTTGLSEAQLEKVEKAAEQTAVLKSANMSMGINLLMKLLKDAAKVLAPAGYDIELVERHHWRLRILSMKRWIMNIRMYMTEASTAKKEKRKKSEFQRFAAEQSWESMR